MGRKDFLSLYSCLWFFSPLEQTRGRSGGKITQPRPLAAWPLENMHGIIEEQKE